MAWEGLIALFFFVSVGPVGVLAQNTSLTRSPPYDTAEETESKIYDLSVWALMNTADLNHPANDTKEYMDKVVAILERRPPRPTSLEDYESVLTNNADATRKGEWLADAFLKLGLNGKQTSRTAIGGDTEIAVYEWTNADGSNVVGVFANRRLISKRQSGLQ